MPPASSSYIQQIRLGMVLACMTRLDDRKLPMERDQEMPRSPISRANRMTVRAFGVF